MWPRSKVPIAASHRIAGNAVKLGQTVCGFVSNAHRGLASHRITAIAVELFNTVCDLIFEWPTWHRIASQPSQFTVQRLSYSIQAKREYKYSKTNRYITGSFI